MSQATGLRRLAGLLALVCCGLGFAVAQERAWLQRQAAALHAPPEKGDAREPAAVPDLLGIVRVPTVDRFREIEKRPLFFQSRRPVAPTAKAEPAEKRPVPPPDAVLTGTIITPRERIALLKLNGVIGLAKVPEGGNVAGWTLSKVLPQTVELTEGERLHRLKIFKAALSGGGVSSTGGSVRATAGFEPDETPPPLGAARP